MVLVDISIGNISKKGFFLEYNGLKLLFILDICIPEQHIINKGQITISIDNKMKLIITLSKDERIIVPLKNTTIVEIKEYDGIPRNYYNLPYLLNQNQKFHNNIGFCTLAYINNELKEIPCFIINKNNNNFEYKYSFNIIANSFIPLLLLDDYSRVFGILDQKNYNEGTYIWVYLSEVEKKRGNQKEIFKHNIDNNTDFDLDNIDNNEYFGNDNTNNNIYFDLDINKKLIRDLDTILDSKDNFFYFIKNKNYPFCFVEASIFYKDRYNDYKIEFNNKYKNKNFSELEKSCIGSMLGMAIGDAIGARVEFLPLSYKFNKLKDMGNERGGRFKLEPGQWTDDTSMGLCLADSLIEKNGEFNPTDIMKRFILWWFCGYNNAFRKDNERKNKHSVGLGGNISGSLDKFIKTNGKNEYTTYGDKNTSGNGSIMRNAAIPICYFRNEIKALEFAKKQSLITHQGDEAAGCCQLMTFIILKILKLKNEKIIQSTKKIQHNLSSLLDNLEDFKCECKSVVCLARSKKENNDENRNWNWKDKNFKYSKYRAEKKPGYIGSYCMDGLAMALHILYKTDNFKDAILKAVNLRGDADSLGSIVGQIAGAYYGLDSIPEEWINTVKRWDDNEIALRGYILYNLNIK